MSTHAINIFNNNFKALTLVGLFFLILTPAASAASDCRPFPTSFFLTTHTHDRVQTFVNDRMDGDWSRLVEKLDRQLSVLRKRHAAGRGVRLRLHGIKKDLAGGELAAYIRASGRRLHIVQCLAQHHSPVDFDNFETAAGSEVLSHRTPSRSASQLQLSVISSCVGGDTVLRIKNTGNDWPRKSNLNIHQIDDGKPRLATSRPMRMKANQIATFRVPKRKNPTGNIGLFINPSWYERPFKLDAEVSCS